MGFKINFGAKKNGAEIVPLTTAKLNSKIEFSDEDPLLQIFVDAAASEIENYIGQPVLERPSLEFVLDHWNCGFTFPFLVKKINEVKYLDADHAEQSLDPSTYLLYDNSLIIKTDKPGDFTSPMIINCQAGFTNEEIPSDIKRAALLIFSHADTYRESMPVKMETSAKAILRSYRIH
jgi:uncharacterized phiE125 gp8 family phage protein